MECKKCGSLNAYYDEGEKCDSYGNVVGIYQILKCYDCESEIINEK